LGFGERRDAHARGEKADHSVNGGREVRRC